MIPLVLRFLPLRFEQKGEREYRARDVARTSAITSSRFPSER